MKTRRNTEKVPGKAVDEYDVRQAAGDARDRFNFDERLQAHREFVASDTVSRETEA